MPPGSPSSPRPGGPPTWRSEAPAGLGWRRPGCGAPGPFGRIKNNDAERAGCHGLAPRARPAGLEGPMTSCMTWLVPAAGPERDRLAAVIAELAAGHGGPVFAPHVTLAGVVEAEPGAVAGVLERPAAGMPPFEVRLTEVGHEPVFFRSL